MNWATIRHTIWHTDFFTCLSFSIGNMITWDPSGEPSDVKMGVLLEVDEKVGGCIFKRVVNNWNNENGKEESWVESIMIQEMLEPV